MSILYINTDLDLVAPYDLRPLTTAFEAVGVWHFYLSEMENGYWHARLQTGVDLDEPETTISAMLDAIEALQGEVYDLWSGCSVRDFDIGYQCDSEPFSFWQGLTNATLLRMSKMGAGMKITLYGSRTEQGP